MRRTWTFERLGFWLVFLISKSILRVLATERNESLLNIAGGPKLILTRRQICLRLGSLLDLYATYRKKDRRLRP
jgi:hypothetical protein